jgi:CHAD domain-containing protein
MKPRGSGIVLRPRESVGEAFVRISGTLIDDALERIRHPSENRSEDVHVIRTTIKRLRALLRLIKPLIAPALFKRENTRLRNAAGRVAFKRDADAARVALSTLRASIRQRADRAAISRVLRGLEVNTVPAGPVEAALAGIGSVLALTKRNYARVAPAEEGWSAFEPGLRAIYREGRKRMRRALETGGDEDFHRWRIRAKNLYHVLQILEPIWEKKLGKLIARLRNLQRAIGDDHDLAVVKKLLTAEPEVFGGPLVSGRVIACINSRSDMLRVKSSRLGKVIFDQKPRQFTRRLGSHWKAWQKEA